MRIAVFNEYWATAGGGEKYAASFAQALRDEHDVDLVGPEPIDVPELEERLCVDLAGVATRRIRPAPWEVTEASRGYDLLLNCSYMSTAPSAAGRSIYVAHFPTPLDHDLGILRRVTRRSLELAGQTSQASLEWGPGFYFPEQARVRSFRWTSGRASLQVRAPQGTELPVRLVLAGRPRPLPPVTVGVLVDGEPVASTRIEPGRRAVPVSLGVVGRGESEPVTLELVCDDTVRPSELLGTHDRRELGVRLCAVALGDGVGTRLAARYPALALPRASLSFLRTYGQVIANSEFTATWVERLWDRTAEVVYPAVSPMPSGSPKEPMILSVGRFFDPSRGHSKKQLELVRAFRAALTDPALAGWSYHLVGGCSPEDRPYLERVRREAEGLPVEIHIDADGASVRDLYARASIFWHGAGLGEDARRHPYRLEHFGIALVEAMSAGAVPIAYGEGGPVEIIEEGVTGLTFRRRSDLVELTRRLAADHDYRSWIAAASRSRARDFAPARFAERVAEVVAHANAALELAQVLVAGRAAGGGTSHETTR